MPANSSIQDYVIIPQISAPHDYPFSLSPDDYTTECFQPTFKGRRQTYLEFILCNPAPTNVKAPWYELARMAAGNTPHLGIISSALDYIEARKDGADQVLHSILRLIFQFSDHPSLSPDILDRARLTVCSFKYWPGEPGADSMCTWTEHHYILFTAAAYLAGQLYPDQIFTNSGLSGEKIKSANRARLLRWLNLRFYTGFSEWLSNVYYDEDLTALLSLVDFCDDEEICERAKMLLDLLLFEMVSHNFRGVFAGSHGRSYEHTKKWASQEPTTDTFKLLFGRGIFTGLDNMSAIAFALSPRYKLPQVIFDISQDSKRAELLHRQRMGINIDQAAWWGLKFNNLEDGMLLLNSEAYFHPRTVRLFVKMLSAFGWWKNDLFARFNRQRVWIKIFYKVGLLPLVARIFQKDLSRNTRQEVNLYTYRTPDYLLSSAQDYQKGFGGDQQHIWQATLSPNAVCFTTHPARPRGETPNYWSGSGSLPRVAQIKNVLISIYHISRGPALYMPNELFFTHAWLPGDQFDEMAEKDGWIFARLADGYLALCSQHPYEWQSHPGEDQNREIIVKGRRNIWICELGRRAVDGEFSSFIQRILLAELHFSASRVAYHSPAQGWLEFSWNGPLRMEGREIRLADYPRYASPYVQAPFPPEQITISLEGQSLTTDWLATQRIVSQYVE